jgi:hypothetical protein
MKHRLQKSRSNFNEAGTWGAVQAPQDIGLVMIRAQAGIGHSADACIIKNSRNNQSHNRTRAANISGAQLFHFI